MVIGIQLTDKYWMTLAWIWIPAGMPGNGGVCILTVAMSLIESHGLSSISGDTQAKNLSHALSVLIVQLRKEI